MVETIIRFGKQNFLQISSKQQGISNKYFESYGWRWVWPWHLHKFNWRILGIARIGKTYLPCHDHAMRTAWQSCFFIWSPWFMAWSWYSHHGSTPKYPMSQNTQGQNTQNSKIPKAKVPKVQNTQDQNTWNNNANWIIKSGLTLIVPKILECCIITQLIS